jgi:hypothetical protein
MREEPLKQQEPRYGFDAYQAAMSDSTLPLFRRGWRGQLTPLGRDEASRLCARGAHEDLYCLLVEP